MDCQDWDVEFSEELPRDRSDEGSDEKPMAMRAHHDKLNPFVTDGRNDFVQDISGFHRGFETDILSLLRLDKRGEHSPSLLDMFAFDLYGFFRECDCERR